jgi:hypothetical protein
MMFKARVQSITTYGKDARITFDFDDYKGYLVISMSRDEVKQYVLDDKYEVNIELNKKEEYAIVS